MIRRSDKLALFNLAKQYIANCKLEAEAREELMHTVAAAAVEERGPQSAIAEIFSPISQAME